MSIYDYQQAFGAWDKTSRAMRKAVKGWFDAYYDSQPTKEHDPCQRIAYTVVSKLTKTVFGEYTLSAADPFVASVMAALDAHAKTALQLALVGGECYIKPCPTEQGFSFTLIPRSNVLVFARNADGQPTDIGTVERSAGGKYYYTLLERRSVDEKGMLTIQNRLFRSLNDRNLGSAVPLRTHPDYAHLPDAYTYGSPVGSVGLVRMKTPMLNCVDGSPDGVSVYAAAMGLIRSIDRNEAQLSGEFDRGESRIIVSSDMLRQDGLRDHLFVGLDEDPEHVGLTVFAPQLRHQSFLERKQEYLRNVESLIGLKRGMLSDANVEERTATEITSSAGDYSLTVMDFQDMWQQAARQTAQLCCKLAALYNIARPESDSISIDWGNGVLYDQDKTWADYKDMVSSGLIKPEIALGWRFNMPADTEEQLQAIRSRFMPQ